MSFRRPRTAEEILMLDDDEASEQWPEGEGVLAEEDDEDADGNTASRFYDEDDSDPDDPWADEDELFDPAA